MPKYLQTIFSTKPWLCISGLRFNLLFALFLLAAYNLPFARKLWSISPSVSFVAGGLFCAFARLFRFSSTDIPPNRWQSSFVF